MLKITNLQDVTCSVCLLWVLQYILNEMHKICTGNYYEQSVLLSGVTITLFYITDPQPSIQGLCLHAQHVLSNTPCVLLILLAMMRIFTNLKYK